MFGLTHLSRGVARLGLVFWPCRLHRIRKPAVAPAWPLPTASHHRKLLHITAFAKREDSPEVLGTLGGRDIVAEQDINPADYFVKRLTKDDIEATFSRSQGAGGQNVNKVSTKADIRFDVVNCSWMSRHLKQAVMKREAGRMNNKGELLISSQTTRSQASNLSDAISRLQAVLDSASESIMPIVSDPAKVKSLKARQDKAHKKRLESKKKRSDKKTARKRVGRDDW